MAETLSSSAKSLNFGRAPAGLGPQVRWLMQSVLPALGRALGVKISIQGADSATQGADGGLNFKVTPGAGADAATHPFKCPLTTDGTTASVVVAGTVNGVSATGLSVTISNSGTKYVYIDVTFAAATTSGGYVTGFSGAITCAMATGASVPSSTSTHLYRQVATYVSGVRTSQDIISSLEVVVRDNGGGTSTPVAIWGAS